MHYFYLLFTLKLPWLQNGTVAFKKHFVPFYKTQNQEMRYKNKICHRITILLQKVAFCNTENKNSFCNASVLLLTVISTSALHTAKTVNLWPPNQTFLVCWSQSWYLPGIRSALEAIQLKTNWDYQEGAAETSLAGLHKTQLRVQTSPVPSTPWCSVSLPIQLLLAFEIHTYFSLLLPFWIMCWVTT